jgi:hypothetical protein
LTVQPYYLQRHPAKFHCNLFRAYKRQSFNKSAAWSIVAPNQYIRYCADSLPTTGHVPKREAMFNIEQTAFAGGDIIAVSLEFVF